MSKNAPYPRSKGQVAMDNMSDPQPVQIWKRRMDAIYMGKQVRAAGVERAMNEGLTPEQAEEAGETAFTQWVAERRVNFKTGRMSPLRNAVQSNVTQEVTTKQNSVMPKIPSRTEARVAGLIPAPAFILRLAMGQPASINGVEIPETPDSVEKIAYEILPAWIHEYGNNYSAKPNTIVKAWIGALKDANDAEHSRPQDRVINAWELQEVVYTISEEGRQFNPNVMRVTAAKIFNDNYEHADARRLTFSQRDPYRYQFLYSVNPADGKVIAATPPDWTFQAEYPAMYPTDVPLPQALLHAINTTIQIRFDTERDFCSVCARWVAGEIVSASQGYARERKHGITIKEIWEIAYRYPVSVVMAHQPHQNQFHGRRASFRNHLDDSAENSTV